MKTKNNMRISELIAIISSVAILIGFAVIPQLFSDRLLRDIVKQTNQAIVSIESPEAIRECASRINDMLEKNDNFFHFLYPHEEVTELEVSVKAFYEMALCSPDEVGQMLTELCNIRYTAEALLETDRLSLNGVF